MLNLVDYVVEDGAFLLDEDGFAMFELLDKQVCLSDLESDIQISEDEVKYYHEVLVPKWKDYFLDLVVSSSRRYIYTDFLGCVSSLQVLFRNNKLYLYVNMRSCDALKKLPANKLILQEFAEILRVHYVLQSSSVKLNIASLHVYISDLLKLRIGNCIRRSASSILIKKGEVLSLGKNDCMLDRCIRDDRNIPHGERIELCGSLHAETHAILGMSLEDLLGSEIYLLYSPCALCSSIIAWSKIKSVYYIERGDDEAGRLGLEILDKFGVKHGLLKSR